MLIASGMNWTFDIAILIFRNYKSYCDLNYVGNCKDTNGINYTQIKSSNLLATVEKSNMHVIVTHLGVVSSAKIIS